MIDATKLQQLIEIVELMRRMCKPSSTARKGSEHASLIEAAKVAEELASKTQLLDIAALANDLLSECAAGAEALKRQIAEVESARGQIFERREAFSAAVEGDPWRYAPRDKQDSFGPFEIMHTRGASVISFSGIKLRSLSYPTGSELAAAVRDERSKLEAESDAIKPHVLAHLRERQLTQDSSNWKLLQIACPDRQGRPPKGPALAALTYALMRMVNSREVDSQPPVLNQQDDAVSLPDIEMGRLRRVYVIALPRATES